MGYHSPVLSLQNLNTEQPTAHVALSPANGKNGHHGPQPVVLEHARAISKVTDTCL